MQSSPILSRRSATVPANGGPASRASLARQRLRLTRRWFAVLAGPPLHVMFVTGAITLFYPALTTWEEPISQQPASVESYQQLLEAAAPPAGDFQLYVPPNGRGRASIAYVPSGSEDWQGFWVGTEPAQSLPRREALAGFIYDLHFFWHRVTGWAVQYLGGLSSIVFLAAIANEWLLRRGPRVQRSRPGRAALALGSRWLLVVYAYTGTLMVLCPLLVGASIGPVFDGDRERALQAAGYFGEELAEEETPEPGAAARALPLDELVRAAHGAQPGMVVESFSAVNFGYANGTIDVRGSVAPDGAFAASARRSTSVRLRTVDGHVLGVRAEGSHGATAAVARWLQMIHHAWYAGTLVRVLLFASIIGGSCAFLASNWRWLERASRTMAPAAPLRVLARWTSGTAAGTLAALAALFLASRLLPLEWPARTVAEELVFPVALTACLFWAQASPAPLHCCAKQLRLAGLLLLPVPALAARWSSAGLFGAGPRLPEVVAVDVGLAVVSLALLAAAFRLERVARRRSTVEPRGLPEPVRWS